MIHLVQTLMLLSFPALVIAAAVTDLTSYTIPNWIPASLIAAFGLAALAFGLPLATVGMDVAVCGVALVAGMAMFAMRWIGGGDAKLFAAAALWLGLGPSVTYLVFTALAGGALAVGLLALRSPPARAVLPQGPAWFARLSEPGGAAPYGVAIAVGALAAFPMSALVARY
ncbi:MAG: prepilin peptidase [Proteobacteria bacterium]|nr:prepilin peptidase [Pseudomonadota bacterium]